MTNESKFYNGIDLEGQKAIGVADPTNDTDGANKRYVDEQRRVFIQETDPGLVSAGLWFELNPDGTLKTLWVENGI